MEAPWMLLGRVLRVAPGPQDAEPEPAAAADFSFRVAAPPYITVVTANRSAHPQPVYPDRYPYVLVANTVGLLVHFSVEPFYGLQFHSHPLESNLVLVRDIHPTEEEGDMFTAPAERLPPRDGVDPIIFNIESIVLASFTRVDKDGTQIEDPIIAELMVTTGSERASINFCFVGRPFWYEEEVDYPLAAHGRDWVPSGVVFHDDRLWWFDLSWGILSCNANPDEIMEGLYFHNHRCITASGDALRYVEIILEDEAAATVCMWTAVPVDNDDDDHCTVVWEVAYGMSFEEIWNDYSYMARRLPRRVPVITAVSPTNPNLVYFSLEQEQRLFAVDVPQHRVVKFIDEAYDLVMPWRTPPSSRYVLAWLVQE
jgi:hypothetical protein